MQATMRSVPSIELEFIKSVKDSLDDVILSQVGASSSINPNFLKVVEAIAKDYVYNVKNEQPKPINARISFTPEDGIVIKKCEDKRFRKIFSETAKGYGVAINIPDFNSLGMPHLKQANVSEEDKIRAEKEAGEELVFVDPYVMQAHQENWLEPIEIDLRIKYLVNAQMYGQTTGYLRFPHFLDDVLQRFNHLRSSSPKICVMGPGIIGETKTFSCPQVMELYSLFPKASYVLLDNDEKLLETLADQFQGKKRKPLANLDPTMLRAFTYAPRGVPSSLYVHSEKYQKIFQQMKEGFIKEAQDPKTASRILNGLITTKSIPIKINPDHFQIRNFDINSSEFINQDKGSFDFVLATMTISNAILNSKKEEAPDNFSILLKFLEILKVNGSLYLDIDTYNNYFKNCYSLNLFESRMEWIESQLGNKLKVELIPIADYLGSENLEEKRIESLTINDLKNGSIPTITTFPLVVITRTSEKAVTPQTSEKVEASSKKKQTSVKKKKRRAARKKSAVIKVDATSAASIKKNEKEKEEVSN